MPARLGLLQNAELFHFSNRSIRSAGPGMRAGKRKTRGHKERSHEQRWRDNVGSPFNAGQQTARSEPTHKAPCRYGPADGRNERKKGKQRRERKEKQAVTAERRHLRINVPAAEPPPAQKEERRRQQKCRKPENLEKEIRAIRSGRPDPVSRRAAVGSWSAYVKRRVLRGIRKQRQRDQHRQRDAQETDELIEPFISSWCQKAHKVSSAFWGRLSVAAGAGASANPPGGTPEQDDDTKRQPLDNKYFQSACLQRTRQGEGQFRSRLSPQSRRPI